MDETIATERMFEDGSEKTFVLDRENYGGEETELICRIEKDGVGLNDFLQKYYLKDSK